MGTSTGIASLLSMDSPGHEPNPRPEAQRRISAEELNIAGVDDAVWQVFNLLSLGFFPLPFIDRAKLIGVIDRWGWHSRLLEPSGASKTYVLYRCRGGQRTGLSQLLSTRLA